MTELLVAQTKMAARTQAIAAQSFPPMKPFTGKRDQNEDSFECGMEYFDECAWIAGWYPDQCLY